MSFAICENKGFHLTFANGWTVSVQFGWGNYCEHHDDPMPDFKAPRKPMRSGDAEVACWPSTGKMVELGCDTVEGWCSADSVLRLMAVVAALPETATELPAGAWANERGNPA